MARFTAHISTTTIVYDNGDRVQLPTRSGMSTETAGQLVTAANASSGEYRYFNKYEPGDDGSGFHNITIPARG